MKKLFIGKKIYYAGTNENEGKAFPVTIVGFDRLAIEVKGADNHVFFLNTWQLCNENGK